MPLAAPPEDPPREKSPLDGRHPLSGATVVNLSPAVAEEMGLDSHTPTREEEVEFFRRTGHDHAQLRTLEERLRYLRELDERTRGAVVGWTALEAVTVLALGLSQAWALRRFFERRTRY
jgi:hypothetical protein